MTAKTVEQYLENINYHDYSGYVPSQFALEFMVFVKQVNGAQQEEHPSPVLHMMMLDQLVNGESNVANLCSRGLAKALPLTSKLFTDTGRVTIADVNVGDSIYGEDGKLTRVTHKSEVFDKSMYRITLADGRTQDVSEDHINVVIHKRKVRYGKVSRTEYQRRELTTKEILGYAMSTPRKVTGKSPKGRENNFWIPNGSAIDYTTKDLPVDPYTLGLLIGDGSMCRSTGYARLHAHKDDMPEYLARIPYDMGKVYVDKRNPNVLTQGVLGIGNTLKGLGLNVHGNHKHIPEEYLYGSISQRTELLKGLMDTDGTVYKNGGCAYSTNSEQLGKDVMALVRSLGGIATMANMGNAYRVNIRCDFPIFHLVRKAERQHFKCNCKVAIESIEPIAQVPSQCIRVDNESHTFLVDDYVVTHNTTIMGEYLFLYLAVYGELPNFGRVNLALYVSDSIENGVKNMRKNLEFRRENSEFLQKMIPEAKFTDIRWEFTNVEGKKFIVKGYGAQALSLDTPLFTKTGRTTIADVQIGDEIFGTDGKLTTVTKKSEVFNRPMYALKLEDGRKLKVCEEHINSVVLKENCNNKATYREADLLTKELLELPLQHVRHRKRKGKSDYTSRENTMFVKNCDPVEHPEADLPLDPYTLGLLLGDGSMKKDGSNVLHAHKDDMPTYVEMIPYDMGDPYLDKRNGTVVSQSIKGISSIVRELGVNVHGNIKFIPQMYLHGSIEQRLWLLKGLIDSDGCIQENGRVDYLSNSEELVDGVSSLVRSLGGTAKKRFTGLAYRIEIWIEFVPAHLKRKALRFKHRTKRLVAVESITRIADEPSQCIGVDNSDHQFIAGDYFRTHNTGVRGAKEMGQRPELAVLDDLVSDEDARSATVIAAIEDTVYKAVSYALHPTKQKTIWSGTPFNSRDPLYKAVESGAWAVNVFPVCEKFPCTREEFKGGWPERFDYDYINTKYQLGVATGKVDTFNQELMLRIMSDDDRLVLASDIQWYRRVGVLGNRENFNFYITTDFATSDTGSSDFSVISVWAYNSNGDWFWVDGICKRQQMDRNFDDLFRLVSEYKPQNVGIEISGQQKGFIALIQAEMQNRGIFFNLAKDKGSNQLGIRPVTDKLQRFRTMEPHFKMGKMFFPHDMRDTPIMKEFMNEISLASFTGFKSKHDDCIDTISMLSSMSPWKPSSESELKKAKGKDPNDLLWEWDEEDPDSVEGYAAYSVN